MAVPFKNVLLATDFSRTSEMALLYAAAVARHFGSFVTVAHIIGPASYSHIPHNRRDEELARMRHAAQSRIADLLASSHFEGVQSNVVLNHGDVLPALSRLVEERDIDLVVAGSHGHQGIEKLFTGSIAEEISRLAACPVMLVGPEVSVDPESEVHVREILYVTDFSEESRRAMNYAYALAKAYAAHLIFLHVTEVSWTEAISTRVSPEAFFRLRFLQKNWPERTEVTPEFLVEFGPTEAMTLETARKRRVQMLVLGVPGTSYPDWSAHLPGPFAYNIACHAPCPVLTLRGDAEAGQRLLVTPTAAA